MTVKVVEILDRMTFIPALAIRVSGDDGYLLRRAGYDAPLVILIALTGLRGNYDPTAWGGRTMPVAHDYIIRHWDDVQNDSVIDVEFILGETTTPKPSEREADPPLEYLSRPL